MIWGSIAITVTSKVHFVDDILKEEVYRDLLSEVIIPDTKQIIGKHFYLLDENDSKHRALVEQRLSKILLDYKRSKDSFSCAESRSQPYWKFLESTEFKGACSKTKKSPRIAKICWRRILWYELWIHT